MSIAPSVAIGAVVFDRFASDARVLLVKRGHAPLAGKWTLPGGRPQADEALVDAARRELLEETALDVDLLCALGVVRIAAEGFDYEIHEFLAVARDPAALRPGDDATDARWAEAKEIDDAKLSFDALRILELARHVVDRFAMKSGVCPKCSHTEILFVPQIADRDDDEMGKLNAYICRSCGYTELYTIDASKLPIGKMPGAKLVDSSSSDTKAKA